VFLRADRMTGISPRIALALVLGVVAAISIMLGPLRRARQTEDPRASAVRPRVAPQPKLKRPPRIPPPMFSRDYVDSLQSVIEMEAEDARVLDRQLRSEPMAWTKRLRLLAYYRRADQLNRPESRRERRRHVFWLMENQPESEILASPFGRLEPGTLTADEEQRATWLWEKALAARSSDARVFWNAAQFFRERNQQVSLQFMRQATRLVPENWHYGFGLGERYGWEVVTALRVGNQAAASAALRELETTKNTAVLEPAVRLLQSEYNGSVMLGQERPVFRDKARQLFTRLEALNPDVDRSWVMPQIDPKMAGMLTRPPVQEDRGGRAESLQKTVRRLRVQDFPELPSGVAAVLRSRGCTIPQPNKDGPNRNVIQGQFFTKGQNGWAVLCSSAGKPSILVFRSDNDSRPEEIAESQEEAYLVDTGQGWTAYQREISAADRKFIITHYRAYGGPEPPPIEHHGVDDAFLEKASVTWYWHNGKWIRLQGAD
jgi:hypothetical protein